MSDELHYPWSTAPAPGSWCEVAGGVRWLRLPLPFALDHINVWLLADGDGWALVDTGIGLSRIQPLWQELFATALEGRPLSRILVTHYHPDHVGQAQWLSRHFGAPVWMPRREFELAQRLLGAADAETGARVAALFAAHGLDVQRQDSLRRRGNAYRRLVQTLPDRVEWLHEGQVIHIGQRPWRVLVGRGHSPEHACLVSLADDFLISGDQVLPRISTNISVRPGEEDHDPLGDYLESLKRLSALPASIRVLPAHGRVFEGLHRRLDALQRHHDTQMNRVLEHCGQPRSAADLLPVLFQRELDEHAILFAMGESIAHLRHLHLQGRLRQVEDSPYRYVVA